MNYSSLIERLITAYADMIGDVAYTQAGQIEGIEITEENDVESEADSETVENVLNKFKEVMGQGAVGIARKTVKEAYEEDKSVTDLDIPEEIKPKEVKAESFASAL